MYSVLFVVFPDANNAPTLWNSFAKKLKDQFENQNGIIILSPNVYQMDLAISLKHLGKLICLCEEEKYRYGLLPLDQKATWLPQNLPIQNTNQGNPLK